MYPVGPIGTLAWVESPFQLLGALEAHSAGLLSVGPLVVLPRIGVEPLARTVAEVRRLGLPDGVRIIEPARAPWRFDDSLAIGDAFSGEVHRLLLPSRPREVVLLDDGRSTRRVMDAVVGADVPLVRPHIHPTRVRAALAELALRKLKRLASQRRLRVVTAMNLPTGVLAAAERAGVVVEHHHFAWLRSLPGEDVDDADTVVLGTSMVANNLIEAEPYLEWIRSLARSGPLTYRAHRREDPQTLGPVGAIPGVTIVTGEVPVEVSLRRLGARHRIVTLPTTAVRSLRLVTPEVRIEEFAVPEAWWLPDVPQAARLHLVPEDGAGSRPVPGPPEPVP